MRIYVSSGYSGHAECASLRSVGQESQRFIKII